MKKLKLQKKYKELFLKNLNEFNFLLASVSDENDVISEKEFDLGELHIDGHDLAYVVGDIELHINLRTNRMWIKIGSIESNSYKCSN